MENIIYVGSGAKGMVSDCNNDESGKKDGMNIGFRVEFQQGFGICSVVVIEGFYVNNGANPKPLNSETLNHTPNPKPQNP